MDPIQLRFWIAFPPVALPLGIERERETAQGFVCVGRVPAESERTRDSEPRLMIDNDTPHFRCVLNMYGFT